MAPEKVSNPGLEDPLYKQSLSWPIAIAAILLAVTTAWAAWDEFVTKRPWKSHQKEFVHYYQKHLDRLITKQGEQEKTLAGRDEAKRLDEQMEAEVQKAQERRDEINNELALLEENIESLLLLIKFPKGELDALKHRLEKADEAAKQSYRDAINRVVQETRHGAYIKDASGKREWKLFTFEEANAEWTKLKGERDGLLKEQGRLLAPISRLRQEREHFLSKWREGLDPTTLRAIKASLDDYVVRIKQIHVEDVALIDRCASCHVGILEPAKTTKKDLFDVGLKGRGEKWVDPATMTPEETAQYKHKYWATMRAMFASHPRPEAPDTQPDLLAIHDPDRFGCSPCHGGNGIATTSVHLAHGLNKHWLWPLYDRENMQAGCNQCHEPSLVVDGAPVLNEGKELFRHLACWGCHKRERFNREVEQLQTLSVQLQENLFANDDKDKERRKVEKLYDEAEDEETILALKLRLDGIDQEQNALITQRAAFHAQQRDLIDQRKRAAPNLKEIRAKLKPEWLETWIRNPKAFRPTTRMPVFRLDDEQVRAIAAFLWQSALDPVALNLPFQRNQPKRDIERGKFLFENRGCMGCHSIDGKGGDFASDLSRIGEKINYDYLVRWVYDPRQRLAPYSPELGRDLLPEDYRKAGRPYEWGPDNTGCPVSGGEIVWQNQTIMPSLRLTWEEARHIATYLMTKKTDAPYEPAPYVTDRDLFERGLQLVKHFGCAGCHEIKGLEDEGGVGTELTSWGTKPIDRIDFGLHTSQYKLDKKYRHKHFAMGKLERPEMWDDGKERSELEALKMPNFYFTRPQRVALTTYLLGSVDSQYPERFYYDPEGAPKDIVEGWWVIKKYNCMGCHQIRPTDRPKILELEWFSGENKDMAPPSLVGEGFRAKPEWLAEFLRDPALSDTEVNRNGVRPYLEVRMPSFRLSEEEIGKLVRFFNALSDQQHPYLEPADEPLTAAEIGMIRPLMDAKCMECHVGGKPKPDGRIIAPSFMLSGERLKPEWMRRWLVDPQKFHPGTNMPVGIFRYIEDEGRWVVSGEIPANMKNYEKDHVELFVRYMRQFKQLQGQ